MRLTKPECDEMTKEFLSAVREENRRSREQIEIDEFPGPIQSIPLWDFLLRIALAGSFAYWLYWVFCHAI